ncbi:MAG TPA: transketolase [Desulfosporosinus sp.]|nr:transketolase [Desulfosporosinus sp.]
MNNLQKNNWEQFAINIRIETLRAIGHLGFGHVGGSMSIVDTLAVLYGGVMKVDPQNPKWEDRDMLVVSKGHAGPAVYTSLALKGFFPIEDLLTLNQGKTHLPSHCDMNLTPGIDMTTGSLGQGSSLAVGMALGNRMDGRDNTTYLILGDGEMQEGQVWEAITFAAHQKLENLITFVDYNKQQLDGYTKDVNDMGDIAEKFRTFGWNAQAIDGHDVQMIYEAIQNAKKAKGQPSAIILNTIKGKGCSFAEGSLNNHHIPVTQEQIEEAIKQLS